VDDSVIILSKLEEVITAGSSNNHVIVKLNQSIKALTYIQEKKPDVVTLDINMPDKNGIELLKEIKQLYPALKVIIITNQSSEQYKIACKKLGADYFVDKSTEIESIPLIIEEIHHAMQVA
jgi:DNA-binding NarL/FixJ family response regulator